MAATGTIEVLYRGFEGGEFNKVGAFYAPKGTFHAKNVLRTRNGLLVPRPGVQAYPKTGLPNGEIHAIGWTGVAGRDLWVLVNNVVYQRDSSDFAAAWVTTTGNIGVEPNEAAPALEVQAGITLISNPAVGLYKLDLTSAPGAVTQVAAVPANSAGRALATWGNRVILGGWSPANRVWYSAANDYTSWPTANFFDIGVGPQARWAASQQGHLAIVLQDGSWWIMTGSTPATGTLRRVVAPQGTWHFWTNSAAILPDDTIHLIPVQGTWPATFDGSQVQELRHLEYAPVQGSIAGEQNVVKGKNREDAIYVSGEPSSRGQAVSLIDGTWTYHEFPNTVAGGVASSDLGYVFLQDFGGPAVAPQVWRYNATNPGRPGGAASNSRVGDASDTPLDTYVELPIWFSEDGHEYRVRQVVVDIWKFDMGLGGGVNNVLDCVVDAYARNDFEGPTSSAQQSMVQATNLATAGGVRDRAIFNFGDQGYGSGFQLRFPQLTGVAIESIVVHLEPAVSRPRS